MGGVNESKQSYSLRRREEVRDRVLNPEPDFFAPESGEFPEGCVFFRQWWVGMPIEWYRASNRVAARRNGRGELSPPEACASKLLPAPS